MDTLDISKFIIKDLRDLTGGGKNFILVNEDSERFTREGSHELEFAQSILEEPGESAYYIYDQEEYESSYRLQKQNDLGYHDKADILEELAGKLDIYPNNLEESVETYNKVIEGEIEDEFKSIELPERKLAEEGPYYGLEVESAIHMTKGGVVSNEKAEVINNNDEPVEGLYASGEVTDISGSYNASVIFGKTSGEEAAKYVLEK